jgi:hypothetical protein
MAVIGSGICFLLMMRKQWILPLEHADELNDLPEALVFLESHTP